MPFRVTFIFSMRADRDASWSENYWNLSDSASEVQTDILAFNPILRGLHGGQSVLSGWRSSPTQTQRLSKLVRTDRNPTPPDDATQSDYMASALLVELGGAQGQTVREWIKGIPDRIVAKGGKYKPDDLYIPKVTAWADALTSTGSRWCLRCLDRTKAPKDIEGVAADGTVTITAHGFPATDTNGARTIIKTAGLIPEAGSLIPNKVFNRSWKIMNIDTNTFQLKGWPQGKVVTTGPGSAARIVFYVYPKIVSAEINFATSKKVGKPQLAVGGSHKKK